jgi:predicted Rossmann-fold nucleotide-binding protein
LNVGGFYDGLLGFLDGLVDAGFVKPAHRDMLIVADTADALLAQLEAYVPPRASKWLTPETI